MSTGVEQRNNLPPLGFLLNQMDACLTFPPLNLQLCQDPPSIDSSHSFPPRPTTHLGLYSHLHRHQTDSLRVIPPVIFDIANAGYLEQPHCVTAYLTAP